jgi:hypothetical protein
VELIDYKGDKATVMFGRHHGRVDLLPHKNFALFFHPVSTGDTGIYMCSLNGRQPESLVQLLVQGELSNIRSDCQCIFTIEYIHYTRRYGRPQYVPVKGKS